jgi:hypothetical protein
MRSSYQQPKKKESVHHDEEDVTTESSSKLTLSSSSSFSDDSTLHDFFQPTGEDSFKVLPLTESFPTGEVKSDGSVDWKYGDLRTYTGSKSNAKADNDCIFKQAVRLTGKIGYQSNHTYGGDGPIPMRYGEWAWSAWFKINKPLQGPVYLIGVGLEGHYFGWSGANGIFMYPTDNKITVEDGDVSFFVDFAQFPLGSWNHILTYTHDHGDRILYINGRKVGAKKIGGKHNWWERAANTALKALVSTSSGNDISIDLPALLKNGMDNPDKTASKLYHQQVSLATNASKFFDAPLMPTRFLPSQIPSTIRRQIPIGAVWFAQKKHGTTDESSSWAFTCMGRACDNTLFKTEGSSIHVQGKGGIPSKENDNSGGEYGGSLDSSGKDNMGMILPADPSQTNKLAEWLGQTQWAISCWIYVKQWGSQPFTLFQFFNTSTDWGQIMLSLDPAHHTLQILNKGKTHKITNLNVSKTLSAGGWHHITLRRKNANTFDVLLNGHKVDTNFQWTELPPSWWGNANFFAYVANTQDSKTHVRIDRLMFWNLHPSTWTVLTYIQNTAPQTYSPPAKIYYTHKGGGGGGGGKGALKLPTTMPQGYDYCFKAGPFGRGNETAVKVNLQNLFLGPIDTKHSKMSLLYLTGESTTNRKEKCYINLYLDHSEKKAGVVVGANTVDFFNGSLYALLMKQVVVPTFTFTVYIDTSFPRQTYAGWKAIDPDSNKAVGQRIKSSPSPWSLLHKKGSLFLSTNVYRSSWGAQVMYVGSPITVKIAGTRRFRKHNTTTLTFHVGTGNSYQMKKMSNGLYHYSTGNQNVDFFSMTKLPTSSSSSSSSSTTTSHDENVETSVIRSGRHLPEKKEKKKKKSRSMTTHHQDPSLPPLPQPQAWDKQSTFYCSRCDDGGKRQLEKKSKKSKNQKYTGKTVAALLAIILVAVLVMAGLQRSVSREDNGWRIHAAPYRDGPTIAPGRPRTTATVW